MEKGGRNYCAEIGRSGYDRRNCAAEPQVEKFLDGKSIKKCVLYRDELSILLSKCPLNFACPFVLALSLLISDAASMPARRRDNFTQH